MRACERRMRHQREDPPQRKSCAGRYSQIACPPNVSALSCKGRAERFNEAGAREVASVARRPAPVGTVQPARPAFVSFNVLLGRVSYSGGPAARCSQNESTSPASPSEFPRTTPSLSCIQDRQRSRRLTNSRENSPEPCKLESGSADKRVGPTILSVECKTPFQIDGRQRFLVLLWFCSAGGSALQSSMPSPPRTLSKQARQQSEYLSLCHFCPTYHR